MKMKFGRDNRLTEARVACTSLEGQDNLCIFIPCIALSKKSRIFFLLSTFFGRFKITFGFDVVVLNLSWL